jgi:hypothetical protein
MSLCAILLLLISFTTPSWAADVEAFPDLNLNDPGSLKEASRVLEEELKLAARPQTYVLIDLVTHTIQIKGRGVELHRIPIVTWSARSPQDMKGIHRLIARPSVVRRKIDPAATVEQEPISLADMPIEYALSFTPPLTIDVVPAAGDNPIQWIVSSGKTLWRNLKNWGGSLLTGQSAAQGPHLQLAVSVEHAQSLAWSLVDGMSLVVRRPSQTK